MRLRQILRLFLTFAVVVVGCRPAAKPQAAGLMVTSSRPVETAGPALTDSDSPVPVSAADPSWGNADALVTLVVFSDFECPFCSRIEPTLAQIRQTYGPRKIRIVWKNEPLSFHDRARPAAEVAMGVFALGGNDAFWKLHEVAFAHQRELTDANLDAWAALSGVDVAALRAGQQLGTWGKKVDKDHDEARRAGVSGTPATFVNGVLASGALPFEFFQAVIDEELSKAEAKLLEGVPRAQLYATLSRANHDAPAPAKPELPAAIEEDTSAVYRVPVGKSPTRGPATALVTIVEFSDFQCPFCKRVQPTLKKIESTYGSKVRFVWKDQPLSFHPLARRAAVFAREARAQKGDTGFWAAHDKLFELQPAIDKSDLERAAPQLGLNLKKVQDAVRTEKYKNDLEDDIGLAEDVKATGTPHFFVNGRRLSGAQPFASFAAIIDEEIQKSTAAVAAGTPEKQLYERIVANGKGPEEPERKTVAAPTSTPPTLGPASAKVTLTVFSDFQCPFCAKVEPTLVEIRKTYGDRVRIVARDLPLSGLHPDAPLAAEAAREAFAQKGNAGYWKLRAALFATKTLGRPQLEEHAKTLGLDLARFRSALDTHLHKPAVDADASAAGAAQITGTPTFLVNDYVLSGQQPLAKFRRLIDRALADKRPKTP